MELLVNFPHRNFRVWRYTVGHAQLLLRSTKTDTFPTQIDVLFKPVDWMSLPTQLTGLIVEFADPEQAQFMSEASGISLEDRASHFFVVRGSNYQGYIVARGYYGIDESTREYYEESEWGVESFL